MLSRIRATRLGGKMKQNAVDFLNRLVCISAAITQKRDETIAYWAPDEPPITIAFSEIGQALVDEIAFLDNVTLQEAFSMIEDGVVSEDEELSTAVATGLIEGMVGFAAEKGAYHQLLTLLRPNSRSHAQAWYTE